MSRRLGVARIGLFLGPVLALLVYLVLPEAVVDDSGNVVSGLAGAGRVVAAVGVWMATWWLTEAVPIPATALLPLALLPLLTGGGITVRATASSYGHDLIFLFMGGFLIAIAMERWQLHRRIALHTILLMGPRPRRVVLGFMLASAFLSMWISNTATVVMMMPIAMSVLDRARRGLTERQDPALPAEGEPFSFALCLLLGTAYGASIGGLATKIGTPPNGLFAAFVEDTYGQSVSFQDWLPIGLSVSVVFLPVCWWLLTRVVFPVRITELPGGRNLIRRELSEQGPMTVEEKRVLVVFVTAAVLWVSRGWLSGLEFAGTSPLAGLSDAGIAMAAAITLFVLPASGAGRSSGDGGRLLDWEHSLKLPWGILILFGGGLSLAAAVQSSGVDRFIGRSVAGLEGVPTPILVVVVSAMVIFLTEMTSNTATTATFLPIMGAVAEGLDVEPLLLLIPMSLSASCAFMMPVATPPNAIVFSSGEITIPQMCKAGLWLNLIGLGLVVSVVYLVAVPLLGL